MKPSEQLQPPPSSDLSNLSNQAKLVLEQICCLTPADESLSTVLDGVDGADVFEIVGVLNEEVRKKETHDILPTQLRIASVLMVVKEQDTYYPAFKTWGEFLKKLRTQKGFSKSNFYKWRNYLRVYDRLDRPENLPSLGAVTEAYRAAKRNPSEAARLFSKTQHELGREPTGMDFPKAKPKQTLAAYIKKVADIANQFLVARQYDQAQECTKLISAAATYPSDVTRRLPPPEFFEQEPPAGSFEPEAVEPEDITEQEVAPTETEEVNSVKSPPNPENTPVVIPAPEAGPGVPSTGSPEPLFPEVHQGASMPKPQPAKWGVALWELGRNNKPAEEPKEPETSWSRIKKQFSR